MYNYTRFGILKKYMENNYGKKYDCIRQMPPLI